jgi:hypothetical protein
VAGETVEKVCDGWSRSEDQECGKSKLNGTALAAWAFKPWFSTVAGVW